MTAGQWKVVKIQEGCELKTAQQLDILHIKYKLRVENVSIDGIMHQKLGCNGEINAFVNEAEEKIVKNLPYVIRIE